MTDAYGAVTWWGFSPAVDLQNIAKDVIMSLGNLRLEKAASCKDELNILLTGAGDIRHILWTVARSYRHPPRKLNFYILESCLELYARDMLLLAIALENPKRMGLQEKTELFLELYGNILVRHQSCEYLDKMSTEFIKMVTDSDYLKKKIPSFDLSQLKFKERDFLEGIYKFWKNGDRKAFDVSSYWDLRLRNHLGVRYDSRRNAFDWDYHMVLMKKDAEIVNLHEYKNWRDSGIAFEVREGTYNEPNKTMASGLIIQHEGEKHARRGYWGDILVSPYLAVGLECEEKSFFKKQNGVYTRGSQHVAEFNITSIFHELLFKEKYKLPEEVKGGNKNGDGGAKIVEITEETELEEVAQKMCEDVKNDPTDLEYEAIPLPNVNITFLPLNSIPDLAKKSKYQNKFDIVYFSNSMVHLLKPELASVFADQTTMILETAKFMLGLKEEYVAQFEEKVTGLAKAAGCVSIEDEDEDEDDSEKEKKEKQILVFNFQRGSQHS